MSAAVRLHPNAESELVEAQDWYNRQRRGLGDQFRLCIDQAVERIQRDPESHPAIYKGARQVLVKRFPYSIIYRIEKQELVIYSVLHGSRHPDVWKQRL